MFCYEPPRIASLEMAARSLDVITKVIHLFPSGPYLRFSIVSVNRALPEPQRDANKMQKLAFRESRLVPSITASLHRQLYLMDVILRMRHPHQPLIKPPYDVVEALDAMPRLSRTRQFMRLSRKDSHRCRPL